MTTPRRIGSGRLIATLAAAGSAMLAGTMSASVSTVNDPPPLEELEPGVTFRVWDVDRALSRVHDPAPNQTPNLDQRRAVIDYPEQGDFGGFGDRFVVEVFGWLLVEEAGDHVFRLTSDDGSLLTIGGKRIIWNRGLHAPRPMDGAVRLEAGLHPMRILMFEHEGGEFLSLAWRPPGAADFEIVPADNLRTERNVTRVVSPGPKRLLDEIEGLRPGDEMELSESHPAYRIETIRPDGFDPMVGCVGTLPDGRLLVGTFEPRNDGQWRTEPDGTIWALEGAFDRPRDEIELEKFADGFMMPLGIAVVDGMVYVAERDHISRLRDTDGDGSYETRDILAKGWISDNYHHFTFGLEARGPYLYATLSTSIGAQRQEILSGEIRGINGPNPPHRGTLVRVDRRNGSVAYIAGGFRTPNGVLALPDRDEVLVGDNQGAWMPANRLNAVRPGRFYGHYNETRVRTDRFPEGGAPSLFYDRPISPPAVWLPQSEIANSPTDFLRIEDGPFEGQILVSDVKYGGIRRAWLEDVDGELQGGVTRHSQGFEGGTNRLLQGPDGTIIVGCIGERATWSWRGTRSGLQRMVPTGETAFEYARVETTARGLRVHLTAPTDRAELENASAWVARQWRYIGSPEYGGTKVDFEAVPVTEAIAAPDRRSVELVMPAMKDGRCVHVRRDLEDDAGRSIHATEFWQTVNRRPGGSPDTAPADDDPVSVLVFSKTAGFRHASIPDGVAAIEAIGAEHGFDVVATEDARIFSDESLATFDVVMFLNTTGDVLDLSQEAAFRRWVQAGGGFVGVHAAADTEYDWPWYGGLVGARFRSHPPVQEAVIEVVDRDHPCTAHLGQTWVRTDEWYDFQAAPGPRSRRLLMLDESSYEGGRMGEDHPIAWSHDYDGGRAIYTGGGHTSEAFDEPDFRLHLLGAIEWAAGATWPTPASE